MFDESEFSQEALDSFFQKGVAAYRKGESMANNPYPVFTAPYTYWENGWWKTFYNETTFFIENLSALSTDSPLNGSFVEDKKYGDAKVYDLALARKIKEAKNNG